MKKTHQERSLIKSALIKIKELQSLLDKKEQKQQEPIAIVGMSCRYPEANNLEEFWQILHQGQNVIKEIPKNRFDIDNYYDENMGTPGKIYVRKAGFMDNIEMFDNDFFQISPREAKRLDPQQRILLEESWKALENAGLSSEKLQNSKTGVFVGMMCNEYLDMDTNINDVDAYYGTGNIMSFAAGRLSYHLGLQGPSMVIETACSSSLVALHLACQSLHLEECDTALVGGVNLLLSPGMFIFLSRSQALSKDSVCRTFDENANGYVRSEGCGVIVIKRLSDAERDNDNILAVVRGSAVTHDGTSSGLTVPNVFAQKSLLEIALKNAQLQASDIGYVESHGTGTLLGDPIEVNALQQIYGCRHSKTDPLIIGSLKSNFGHLEAASGIIGLMKAILCSQKRTIPQQINVTQPSSKISWDSAIAIPRENLDWQKNKPLIAGVSSFGMSGTNAHVIVEGFPEKTKVDSNKINPLSILTLSAKTQQDLDNITVDYDSYIKSDKATLQDICFSANVCRTHFEYRKAIICDGNQREQFANNKLIAAGVAKRKSLSPVFLFTGQGSQYPQMAQKLYEFFPTFRSALDKCDVIAKNYLQKSLISILRSESQMIHDTAYSQPAIFAVEYALARLWMDWGIQPASLIGHSIGEYVAAVLANVFSLEDGLRLVIHRGQLMQQLPKNGSMAVIFTGKDEVLKELKPFSSSVSIAAFNTPENIVISGLTDSVNKLIELFHRENIKTQKLTVSHAFHSPSMIPMLENYEKILKQVKFSRPQLTIISNLTGKPIDQDITKVSYWLDHIYQPVQFAKSISLLCKEQHKIFLEIGSHPILVTMASSYLPKNIHWLHSLHREKDDIQQMLIHLGKLYTLGAQVNWDAFYKDRKHNRVELPNYPFTKKHFWTDKTYISLKATSFFPGEKLSLPESAEIRFASEVSRNSPLSMQDHILKGNVVVSSAHYVVMALKAAFQTTGSSSCNWQNIVFLSPLVIANKQDIQFILKPEDSGYSAKIVSISPPESSQVHATLNLSATPFYSKNTLSLSELQKKCNEPCCLDKFYQTLSESGYYLGNSFRCIKNVWKNNGNEVLGELILPAGDLSQQEAQVGLIDSCFRLLLIGEEDKVRTNFYVPFQLKDFKLYLDIPESDLWAYVNKQTTSNNEITADIVLLDSIGQIIFAANEFTLRKSTTNFSLNTPISSLFHKISWRQKTIDKVINANNESGTLVVVENESGTLVENESGTLVKNESGIANSESGTLVKNESGTTNSESGTLVKNESGTANSESGTLVKNESGTLIILIIFTNSQRIKEQCNSKLTQKSIVILYENACLIYKQKSYSLFENDLDDIFRDLDNSDKEYIIWLEKNEQKQETETFSQAQIKQYLEIVTVVQKIIHDKKTVSISFVTRNVKCVFEEQSIHLEFCLLSGLAKSLGKEYDHIRFCHIDLDIKKQENDVNGVVAEVLSCNSEEEVAIRNAKRYVSYIEPSPKIEEHSINIRREGTYVITGGTKGLGLLVADWLVAKGAKNLVLLSRSGGDVATDKKIIEWNNIGVHVVVLQIDVSRLDILSEAFAKIADSLPQLRGIIHAAGVLSDKFFIRQSSEDIEKVVLPKIAGAWNLHLLTKKMELDFFVCFSSIASILGSEGQTSYSAANSFLDALAYYRHSQNKPALSINWGPWGDVGMAANLTLEQQQSWRNKGIEFISPQQGIEALEKAMLLRIPQVAIMQTNSSSIFNKKKNQLNTLASPKQLSLSSKLADCTENEVYPVLLAAIQKEVSEVMGFDAHTLPLQKGLFSAGMDSIMALELRNRLETIVGSNLPATLSFSYPSIEELANFLNSKIVPKINKQQNFQDKQITIAPQTQNEAIAIVGMACRFPGSDNLDSFWQNLHSGMDCISEIPITRWNSEDYFDPTPTIGKMYTHHGYFLKSVDTFDPYFFGITPKEAHNLDPQQRLLLEVSWEALENANVCFESLKGSQTGVYMGLMTSDYEQLQIEGKNQTSFDSFTATGTNNSFVAGRISYFLGLNGPSMVVATACSSSLVSVHLSCQALRNGECDMALAGGVNLMLAPNLHVMLSQMQALSPDGKCKTFDSSADGYGRGEGCGVVVLKKISRAIADNDNIYAVIKGSAVNHDGASSRLTAPNGVAQTNLIQKAQRVANIEADNVDYLEVHGTGTELGDPIEVLALADVFAKRSLSNPLFIGSVKTNIGHLEASAGVASLIKVVLALKNKEIPAHLHLQTPNPHIPWKELPFSISKESIPWAKDKGKRIAGISSFGLSGVNAHVIVEEYVPEIAESKSCNEDNEYSLLLSAKSKSSLQKLTLAYSDFLERNPAKNIQDICFTAYTRRAKFEHRLGIVGKSKRDLQAKLKTWQNNSTDTFYNHAANTAKPSLVFLFTGQGSQYPQMGKDLYEACDFFRKTINSCESILSKYMQKSLLEIMHGDSSFIDETIYTQPALFAFEYSLAKLWIHWGVRPDIVMGHSIGEYVAACIAGVFSVEDGLKLIAKRGELMQASQQGKMAVVFSSLEKVREKLAAYSKVTVAAINGLQNIVISGCGDSIDLLCKEFQKDKINTTFINVSRAFHSPLIEPVLAEFAEIAKTINYQPPQIKFISNLSGKVATTEVTQYEYWLQHALSPVMFYDTIQTLQQQNYQLFLEIGPQPMLSSMAKHCLPENYGIWLTSARKGNDLWGLILRSMAQFYSLGVNINGDNFYTNATRQNIHLPTYPFERERYWLQNTKHTTEYQPHIISQIESPLIKGVLLELEYDIAQHTFLKDHKVDDKIVVAASSYISIILSIQQQQFNDSSITLEDISFEQPLVIVENKSRLQLFINKQHKNNTFQIASLTANKETCLHSRGNISYNQDTGTKILSLKEIQRQCTQEMNLSTFYEIFEQQNISVGSSFKWLKRICFAENKVVAEIVPFTFIDNLSSCIMHPGLLDSCFRLLIIPFASNINATYIPFSIKQVVFYKDVSDNDIWCYCETRADSSDSICGNITVLNKNDEVVCRILELRARKTSTSFTQKNYQKWLYTKAWENKKAQPLANNDDNHWLIFMDDLVSKQLMEILQDKKHSYTCVFKGKDYLAKLSSNEYYIDPENKQHYANVLSEVFQNKQNITVNIIYLWCLEKHCNFTGSLPSQMMASIYLSQALLEIPFKISHKLFLITRGSSGRLTTSNTLNINYSFISGIVHSLRQEQPSLKPVLIDLDIPCSQNEGKFIYQETTTDYDSEVVWRQDTRYVAKLTHLYQQELQMPQQAFAIKMPDYGRIEDICFAPINTAQPNKNEVVIEVVASGINFRDLLRSMGMLQDYTDKDTLNIPFGFECAGRIVAVGSHCNFKVGDEVMALAVGSLASHVYVRSEFVSHKPKDWSFEESATIPLAFLTTHYALISLAKITSKDTILIHAAAGGVGLAAIQLAQKAGARILATAHKDKWEFLRSLGIENIMSSRSLDFEKETMLITNGKGVDVVLNSLNGDFIPSSLRTLSNKGRFVEIGKIGIWEPQQVLKIRSDIRYFILDLYSLASQKPEIIAQTMQDLNHLIASSNIKPLPHKVFFVENVKTAFSYMARSKHIGKIVINLDKNKSVTKESKSFINDNANLKNATYLVTGANGALGWAVSDWLVKRGVGNLALTSRSLSQHTQKLIKQWKLEGVNIQFYKLDIANTQEVHEMFMCIKKDLPELKGIFHLAGVVNDNIVTKQTKETFVQVMHPKVNGTWNLHNASLECKLDFFVCFSSVASLLGSPAQCNYAAANAFMDAFAHYRNALGLYSLSINWGPWHGSGMASHLTEKNLDERGFRAISPEDSIAILENLLHKETIQAGVFAIDWRKYLKKLSFHDDSFFANFISLTEKQNTKNTDSLVNELKIASSSQRSRMVYDYLGNLLVKMMIVTSKDKIAPQQRLFDLGLDSLMAVELRNQLQVTFEISLSSTLIFDYPTLESLQDYILKQVFPSNISIDNSKNFENNKEKDIDMSLLLNDINEVSDDEIYKNLRNKRKRR